MDFNQSVSDKEILSHVKTLLKVPLTRRSLLANIEQITYTFKEVIDNPGSSAFPWNSIPICVANSLGLDSETDNRAKMPIYSFSLVKKNRQWILEDLNSNSSYVRHLFYSFGVTEHIAYRLGKIKKMEGEMLSFFGIPMIRWISISAKKVNRKKINGSILICIKNKKDQQRSFISDQKKLNNILFINTAKLKSNPDAPGIYRMIEDISVSPELGAAMWEYYHLKLKPLFREMNSSEKVS